MRTSVMEVLMTVPLINSASTWRFGLPYCRDYQILNIIKYSWISNIKLESIATRSNFLDDFQFKGTLMQIWKFHCMFGLILTIPRAVHISKSKRSHNAKPSAYYFYVKTKVSVKFHICISVPLNTVSAGDIFYIST